MNIALCKFSLRKSNGDDSLTNKASWLPTKIKESSKKSSEDVFY